MKTHTYLPRTKARCTMRYNTGGLLDDNMLFVILEKHKIRDNGPLHQTSLLITFDPSFSEVNTYNKVCSVRPFAFLRGRHRDQASVFFINAVTNFVPVLVQLQKKNKAQNVLSTSRAG